MRVRQIHTIRFRIPSGSDRNAVALDVRNVRPTTLILSAAWTTAAITFLSSSDGVNFKTLLRPSSLAVKIEPVKPGAQHALILKDFDQVNFLFVVSGDLLGSTVNQVANRDLVLLCEDRDASNVVGGF